MDLTQEKNYGNVGKRPLANTKESKKKKVKLDPGIKVELPNEIWTKIMSYLNSEDLFQNVNLVCRHFYNIHRSAAKYLEVKNIKKKDHFKTVIKVLSDCKSLKMFKIEGNCFTKSYMDEIIKQALISCQNIKTLKVFSDLHHHDDYHVVFEDGIFKTFTCIDQLNMKLIGKFGTKLEHLVLCISKHSMIENSKEVIKKLIQNCPKLNHIHLKGGFSNIPNQFILDMLKNFNVRITIKGRVLSSGKK